MEHKKETTLPRIEIPNVTEAFAAVERGEMTIEEAREMSEISFYM